jgi:glutaredoxin 3
MAQIDIYTRLYCGYCDRAKALLDKKGVAYTEFSSATNPEVREQMIARAGRNTFPQIFIDGLHVGGCDDLYALDSRGGLDPLLSA